MPSFFRRRLPFIVAMLLLASGISACTPLCPQTLNNVWIGEGYTRVSSSSDYRQPTNTWIENPQMASFVADTIKGQSMHFLAYRLGFKCLPNLDGDCPDCLVCTLNKPGVIGHDCRPDGDLFVKAEIGPGTSVRAQTYWRR